jgi:general secretion pathway protein N
MNGFLRRARTHSLFAAAALAAAACGISAAQENPNPWSGLALEVLEATRTAPLFTPTRRPPPVFAPAAELNFDAVEAGPLPPPLQLVGTVMTSGAETALLLDTTSGEVHRVAAGEDVDGWSVEIVDGRTVALRAGGESHVLTMFESFGPPAFGSLPGEGGPPSDFPFGPFGGPPVFEEDGASVP